MPNVPGQATTIERREAEEPADRLLRALEYAPEPAAERGRDALLIERLREALLRLNEWLTSEQADRAIFKLCNVDAVGMARNQVVHEYLTYGMPLLVDTARGRETLTVRFLDFDHPDPADGRNEFLIATQVRIRRGRERDDGPEPDDERLVIPDIVLYVNGLPLVVMEAKAGSLLGDGWRSRAVGQLLRYQEAAPEWRGRGAPELFDTNLMCVALSGAEAVFGAVGAREHEYAAWKSIEPFTGQEVRERFGVEPVGQAQLILGLLRPATSLEILRDYVVFEPEKGRMVKKLPRYQQYRAVTATMERILRHERPSERGGVIWHTQGSGKSLTMLWLATKLRREPRLRNPTIVIVTDRVQLDDQITRTFERCGFPAPDHPATSSKLRDVLATNDGRTIMTTVQKFDESLIPLDGATEPINAADNVFVMVDEAHRTQYGLLAARMRKALPRATFIGFTGTPIDKGFKRSTMREFGSLIDSYTIPQSVADGATVPIFYEARLPDLNIQGPTTLDKLFEAMFGGESPEVQARLRRRYANKETLAEAEKRIEGIALDIAQHFLTHVQPNGFKGQVVAPSREAAVRYADNLRRFEIAAYPIITTSNEDTALFDEARALDHKQIINQFLDPGGKAQLLVVVDMLLTGFDAPIEQVLYLDRGLREHGLLQAIARVNRRCMLESDGVRTEKTYGLVVDYWGVSRDLDAALSSFEPADVQEAWEALQPAPGPVIEAAARQAEGFFSGRDLDDVWACVAVFGAEGGATGDFRIDVFEQFSARYRDFAALLDRFLPDPAALPYVNRLARLTKIRAYARAQFLRQDASIDWEGMSAKVKKLIDDRIDADVKELMKPVSILDERFGATIASLPHDEARASVMEHAIRAQITERYAENPTYYERLSEQLARIIDEMRRKLLDAATAVAELWKLRQEAMGAADVAAQQGLSEVSFAVYELLEHAGTSTSDGPGVEPRAESPRVRDEPAGYHPAINEGLKRVALEIERIMAEGQLIVDWHNKEDVQRVMRRDIKRELRKLSHLTEEQLNELASSMVEIAKRRRAR